MVRCAVCEKPHCVCGCDMYEDDGEPDPARPLSRRELAFCFWLIGAACGMLAFACLAK